MWYHLTGATYSEYSQQSVTTSFPWQVALQKGFYYHLLQRVVQMQNIQTLTTSNTYYLHHLVFHWVLWIAATDLVQIIELNNGEKLLFHLFLVCLFL